MILIKLDEAVNVLNELYAEDISNIGCETLETFDAKRAVKALNSIDKITNAVIPVYCHDCKYAVEETLTDSGVGKCRKFPGGYFGKHGYCSEGILRNQDWLMDKMDNI